MARLLCDARSIFQEDERNLQRAWRPLVMMISTAVLAANLPPWKPFKPYQVAVRQSCWTCAGCVASRPWRTLNHPW